MKLQLANLAIVLGIVEFTGMVNGLCLIRNTATSKVYWYQCFKSNDYLADIKKAPIDIPRVTFANSKVRVIENGSFNRLNQNLQRLAFFYCGVEEIEDNAFNGLNKLDLLAFVGNKLKVIKSAWFKGLSNLQVVSFQSNQIKHIESDFFSILPPLEALDISINDITCLQTATFGNFKVEEFHFRHNPLTWKCQVLLMNWLKDTNIRIDYLQFENVDAPYELTKMCAKNLPTSEISEEFLAKCVQETAGNLLPPMENYTVNEVCEFLKDKLSPFLNCTDNKF